MIVYFFLKNNLIIFYNSFRLLNADNYYLKNKWEMLNSVRIVCFSFTFNWRLMYDFLLIQ